MQLHYEAATPGALRGAGARMANESETRRDHLVFILLHSLLTYPTYRTIYAFNRPPSDHNCREAFVAILSSNKNTTFASLRLLALI